MGTGWQRRTLAAVMARRARVADNGYCFYEEYEKCVVSSPGGGDEWTNRCEVQSNDHINNENPTALPESMQLKFEADLYGTESSKLGGCDDGEKQKKNSSSLDAWKGFSSKNTRISVWADASDEPPLVPLSCVPRVDVCNQYMENEITNSGIKGSIDNQGVVRSEDSAFTQAAEITEPSNSDNAPSPMSVDAEVFVTRCYSGVETAKYIALMHETVECQKQHIAHLLGQVVG